MQQKPPRALCVYVCMYVFLCVCMCVWTANGKKNCSQAVGVGSANFLSFRRSANLASSLQIQTWMPPSPLSLILCDSLSFCAADKCHTHAHSHRRMLMALNFQCGPFRSLAFPSLPIPFYKAKSTDRGGGGAVRPIVAIKVPLLPNATANCWHSFLSRCRCFQYGNGLWIVDYKLPMCHILFLAASICFSRCPREAFKIDEGFPL